MILEPDISLINIRARSKKQVLEDIASGICHQLNAGIDCVSLLKRLMSREQIGSTAIGGGVAIPHIRLNNIDKPIGVFVRLKNPVDFDAPDDVPVDMIYLLIAPSGTKGSTLMHLSRLSNFFRNDDFCERLRHCEDPFGSIHECNAEQERAAA